MSRFDVVLKVPLLRSIATALLVRRAQHIVNGIRSHILPGEHVLDIGAGSCHVAELVAQYGCEVTAVDVVDQSFVSEYKPMLYDGIRLPFDDNSFDVALLITVLHHIKDPVAVLAEAQRVCRRLVIIEEDIYDTAWRKYVTFLFDSAYNFEWIGHPHTNKTDKEWRRVFDQLGLSVGDAHYFSSHAVIQHARYFLTV